MRNYYCYETPIGTIGIADNGMSGGDEAITAVFFPQEDIPEAYIEKETPMIKNAGKQLLEYMNGERTSFHLTYELEGTEFEKKVWNALLTIPYGETRSYKEIAEKIGNKHACRAVGGANSRNRIPIFIPCHRVIGANGKLTGFAGGLDMKKALLKVEGI